MGAESCELRAVRRTGWAAEGQPGGPECTLGGALAMQWGQSLGIGRQQTPGRCGRGGPGVGSWAGHCGAPTALHCGPPWEQPACQREREEVGAESQPGDAQGLRRTLIAWEAGVTLAGWCEPGAVRVHSGAQLAWAGGAAERDHPGFSAGSQVLGCSRGAPRASVTP